MGILDRFFNRSRPPQYASLHGTAAKEIAFGGVDPVDSLVVATCVRSYQASIHDTNLRLDPNAGNPTTQEAQAALAFYQSAPDWFFDVLTFDYLIHGNAYFYLEPDSLGVPLAPSLLRLDPLRVELRHDGQALEYHHNGKLLDPLQVLHFRNNADPCQPWYGRSQVREALPDVWTEKEAYQFTGALLHNLGVAGIVVSLDEDAREQQPPDRAELEEWGRKLNEGLKGVLRGSSLFSTRRLQVDFLKGGQRLDSVVPRAAHNRSEERICAAFRLQPAYLGFGTGLENSNNDATITELGRLAWRTGYAPYHKALTRQLNKEVRRVNPALFGGDYYLELDHTYSSFFQEEQRRNAIFWSGLVTAGIATANEARVPFNLPPHADGNELRHPAGPASALSDRQTEEPAFGETA